MDEEILQQIFAELFSSLEPLETQIAALLQFLKSKGIATDEELAPFLEQAGNVSNIRWRAAGVRTAALISSALQPAEKHGQTATAPAERSTTKPAAQTGPASENTASETNTGRQSKAQDHEPQKPKVKKPGEVRRDEDSQKEDASNKTKESAAETASEADLRNAKLSNPPLIKTGRYKTNKDTTKDKEVKSADSTSSGQSAPEAKSKREAA